MSDTEYKTSGGYNKVYTTKDAIISSGQALSGVVDLEQLNITGLLIPAGWTAAQITFQVSPDGTTFGDLLDASGNEVKLTVSAGKFIGVNLSELSGARFIKVRSGTSGTPVNQAADRTISLVLTSNAEASAGGSNGGTISAGAATMPAATTMQNAATANGNGTSLNVQGYATAIINVSSSPSMAGGTAVNFEASTDDTEWQPILAHQIGVQGNQILNTSTDGDYRINCAGFKSVRTRISNYSAGAVTTKGYVTPQSGHPTTVTAQLSDGTNSANILKGDGTAAGQSSQLVAGSYKELTGLSAGALNADLIPSTDVSGYKSFAIQVRGTFSGTLTVQGSNDGTNWDTIPTIPAASNNATLGGTITATGLYVGPIYFRYLRVRMTSYTSGTATAVAELFTHPFSTLFANAVITNNPTISVQSSNITVESSSAKTTSGNSSSANVSGYKEGFVTLNCTASSGSSPTLDVKLQGSDDGGTTWYDIPNATFTQLTTTGSQAIQVNTFSTFIRAKWTIGGSSPSFMFAIKGSFKA